MSCGQPRAGLFNLRDRSRCHGIIPWDRQAVRYTDIFHGVCCIPLHFSKSAGGIAGVSDPQPGLHSIGVRAESIGLGWADLVCDLEIQVRTNLFLRMYHYA